MTLHYKKKDRYKADVRAMNILLQGLPKDIYTLINHYTDAKDILDNLKQHEAHANENKLMLERYTQHVTDPLAFVSNVSLQQNPTQSSAILQSTYGSQNRVQGNNAKGAAIAGNGGVQNRVGNANPGQAKPIKCSNYNGIGHEARQCTQPKRPQNSDYFKDKMLLLQAQENGVVLNEEQLLFIAGGQDNTFDDDVDEPPVQDLALNVDQVFQADQCDAFDSDVGEAPTPKTMFMANLSSADPIYDEAGPSYDSDILSEVQDHDNYLDSVGEYHEVHEMQNDIQQNYVVDSDAEYMSDSNIILYEQARFELTEREQNIDEQLRIIIIDRNIQEESLKKELHSVKMQLNSTIDHNKLMKEEVETLKKDFKQKESKYHEDFLDMKELKEKVEDKLFKQDKSLQTVHITMQVQSALYNGHEIVKTNYAPAVKHDSEDTLELAEITRKRMLEKMKSPMWVKNKIKIAPSDYSKENYLATFTPQR
ncbi:hypothetical protein Tco_0328539 [Tanacetum coccineum]